MLNIIGVSMLVIGFIGLFVSILLAFIWRVPDLLDDLSGRKARRQIKHLKEINVGTGGTGGMESIRTNELYNIMDSGNLVWSSLDSSKDSREDLDENKEEDSKVISEEEGSSNKKYILCTKNSIPRVSKNLSLDSKKEKDEVDLFTSEEEGICTSEFSEKRRINSKVIIIQEESSIF